MKYSIRMKCPITVSTTVTGSNFLDIKCKFDLSTYLVDHICEDNYDAYIIFKESQERST